jgi:hypothetical protein
LGEARRGFRDRIRGGDAERVEAFLAGEVGEQGFRGGRI